MRKQEVLILNETDLTIDARKKWENNERIEFSDLHMPYCEIIKSSFIFILTKHGDLQIIKERYKIIR